MTNLLRSLCMLSMIILISACNGDSASTKTKLGSKQDKVLTVYLNDFDNLIGPLFTEKTGYNIELVQGSGAEILSRIEAERGNPHWDVVWIDMIASVHGLGQNGLLYEGYLPEKAAHMKENFYDFIPEEKWYYPTSAHASSVIVYNNQVQHSNNPPMQWSDFADSTYFQAVGMADPTIAAPAYSFVSWFFQQNGIDNGKLIMNSWFDNGLQVFPKNPNVAIALNTGQIKVAALQENNAYMLLKQKQPISIVWPEEGAPAAVRVAAISKNTEQLEAAKAFVNFLLDPAVQQTIIDQSEDAYHEPSAIGVDTKPDRHPEAKLLFPDVRWSHQHEFEIKQWFADYSIR